MKITKEGKIPPPQEPAKYKGVCTNCGTHMEAMEKELKKEFTSVYGYSASYAYYADCMLCGYRTNFKQVAYR